jgi:Raf kinase inhibitor-like YbhB/YbcL family protein
MNQKNCKVMMLCIGLSFLFFFSTGYASSEQSKTKNKEGNVTMQLTSSAFKEGQSIPVKYTCDGKNVSPQLKWSNVPQGTKSLALICDDPDAPHGTFVHWVLYSIPPTVTELKEGIPPDSQLSNGAKHGMPGFNRLGYGGPCPPSGRHRYFFKLYALDFVPSLTPGATKSDLLKAMEGHILEMAQLMGTYQRTK